MITYISAEDVYMRCGNRSTSKSILCVSFAYLHYSVLKVTRFINCKIWSIDIIFILLWVDTKWKSLFVFLISFVNKAGWRWNWLCTPINVQKYSYGRWCLKKNFITAICNNILSVCISYVLVVLSLIYDFRTHFCNSSSFSCNMQTLLLLFFHNTL